MRTYIIEKLDSLGYDEFRVELKQPWFLRKRYVCVHDLKGFKFTTLRIGKGDVYSTMRDAYNAAFINSKQMFPDKSCTFVFPELPIIVD